MALIATVCIPMLVFELGIEVLPSLFNPDFYTELFEGMLNIPELQPDAFLDYIKILLENGVEL